MIWAALRVQIRQTLVTDRLTCIYMMVPSTELGKSERNANVWRYDMDQNVLEEFVRLLASNARPLVRRRDV